MRINEQELSNMKFHRKQGGVFASYAIEMNVK
jgi:hypothetical protein